MDRSVVLTEEQIFNLVENGRLIEKDTFERKNLESCSYDVRVGARGILGGKGEEIDLGTSVLELSPGSYAGIISFEKLLLPQNVFARIGSKRSYSYEGIILLSGSLVDPGYEGHLLFGLYNASQKKVIIRRGQKICTVVFEQLPVAVERKVQPDPYLLDGEFPNEFVNKMANMDVLPWMQISERVKQIEEITKDIIDLRARYDDVLKPIQELTKNVEKVSADVATLAQENRRVSKDLDQLREITGENAKQIAQITNTLATVGADLRNVAEKTGQQDSVMRDLSSKYSKFSTVIYVVGAVLLVALGAFLSYLITK